jgi:hypothetical protein
MKTSYKKSYYKAPPDWNNQSLMTCMEWENEIPYLEEKAKETLYYEEGIPWEDQRYDLLIEVYRFGESYFMEEPNLYIFKTKLGARRSCYADSLQDAIDILNDKYDSDYTMRNYETVEIYDRFNNKLYTLEREE